MSCPGLNLTLCSFSVSLAVAVKSLIIANVTGLCVGVWWMLGVYIQALEELPGVGAT